MGKGGKGCDGLDESFNLERKSLSKGNYFE